MQTDATKPSKVGSCCVRLHVNTRFFMRFKVCATTPNNTQQRKTSCQTLLDVTCFVRLSGICCAKFKTGSQMQTNAICWANNVGSCYVRLHVAKGNTKRFTHLIIVMIQMIFQMIFLKISKEIGKAWRMCLTRAKLASLTRPFSASFQTFCLTALAYLKYAIISNYWTRLSKIWWFVSGV